MIEKLTQIVNDLGDLKSQLVLLVGTSENGAGGKSALLKTLGERNQVAPMNVGLELGRRLLPIPKMKRAFSAGQLLRELADQHGSGGLLLLDNIELLFEKDLQVNPLELLKQLAHSKKVVVAWPGQYHAERLTYADTNHPEHRDYGCDGLVVFEINPSYKQ